MPISGKFEADFESFHREVQKADGALRGFTDNSGKVATSFTRLSDTGGGAFRDLHQSVSQVDRILAQFGINIGGQVSALRELAELAGKSGTGLNLLAKGSLVVTTALAAWKLGRYIAELTDMDAKVADLAASFMGWGSVLSETASYRVEQLSKASQIAGRQITDMTEAAKINGAEIKRLGEAHKKAADDAAKAWQKAKDESAKSFAEMEQLGNRLAGQDIVQQATDYLDALNDLDLRGLKPLRSSYADIVKVTGEAITALRAHGETGTQVYGELLAAFNKYTAALEPGLLRATHLGVGLQQAIRISSDETITTMRRANDALEDYNQAQQETLKETNDGLLIIDSTKQAHEAAGQAAQQSTDLARAGYAGLAQQVTLTGEAIRAVIDLQKFSAGVNAILQQAPGANSSFFASPTTSSQFRQIAALPGGSATTVNVDARGALLNTPGDQSRLADIIDRAVSARMRSIGARF